MKNVFLRKLTAAGTLAFASLLITAALIGVSIAQAQDPTPTPDSETCPLGQGYWSSWVDAWPVDALMLGAQVYTQAELLALLPGGGGDASTQLAVQLIAAKLNVFNGADPEAAIGAIAEADVLLAAYVGALPYGISPASPEGQQMIALAESLEAYNSGSLTPNCEEPEETDSPEETPEVTETPTATPTPSGTFPACQNQPPAWAPAWGWRWLCGIPYEPGTRPGAGGGDSGEADSEIGGQGAGRGGGRGGQGGQGNPGGQGAGRGGQGNPGGRGGGRGG